MAMKKKTAKKAVLWILFAASCIGIWTIFVGGIWSAIGILSVCIMAMVTICTWIDESREGRR